MRRLLGILTLVLALMISGAVVAQESNEDGGDTYVRFAHLNPNVENVDVYVNGELSDVADFGFESISDWVELEPGAYDIAVTAAGDSLENAAVSLEDFNLPLGQFTTAAVVSDNEGTPAIVAAAENYDVLPAASSRITFLNALSSEENINFLRDGIPFVTSLGRNAEQIDSYSITIPVDSGTYDFSSVISETEAALGDVQDVEIVDGNSYLIYAFGTVDGDVSVAVEETEAYEIAILQDELNEPGTLLDAINSNEPLTPYADAFEAAGLTDALTAEDGETTVFLPAGFLVDEVQTAVGDDTDLLNTYLINHAVEGDLRIGDLLDMTSVTTLGGAELPVEIRNDALFVGGSRVIVANIAANNGVIHVIGNIINPETGGPVFTEDDINLMDDAEAELNMMETGFGVEDDMDDMNDMEGDMDAEMTPEPGMEDDMDGEGEDVDTEPGDGEGEDNG